VDPVTIVLAARGPGPEDQVVLADDAGRATAALWGLPVDQRRALALAALGGRTAREIGEIESIPLGTAKTRVRTALLRVRDSLAEGEVRRD
jgi:RNA polymerase sigma-70 factor (ECF subfamily)